LPFQSSPGLSTGRYQSWVGRIASLTLFQSSPGLSTGRYLPCPVVAARLAEFQSSPGLSTGRYIRPGHFIAAPRFVSILARPFDRTLPVVGSHSDRVFPVSILARPFDRTLQVFLARPDASP